MALKHRQWSNFASWQCSHSPLLDQLHLSPTLLSAVQKMGCDCCCSFSKQKWACFYYELGWNGIHFIFTFFSQWVCRNVFFFHLTDNALVWGRRRLLLRYPLLFDFPFFHVHFMAVTTAVKGLSIVKPNSTLQGGSSLTVRSFHFFSILLSEQVSRGQRARGNKNRGGNCSQPEFQLLISSLCSLVTPIRESK